MRSLFKSPSSSISLCFSSSSASLTRSFFHRLYWTLRKGSSLSSLAANPSWLSPNQEFAFGFQKLPNDNENHFFFNNIPETIVVWFANTESAPQGYTLKLTDDGKLVLYDQGNSLWEPSSGGAKSMRFYEW